MRLRHWAAAATAAVLALGLVTPAAAAASPPLDVKRVSAGDDFSYALGSDGRLYGWGDNSGGLLGIGTDARHVTPVKAKTSVRFTQVDGGGNHALALAKNGSIYAWGWDSDGRLGIKTDRIIAIPTKVPTPKGVKFRQVSAGDRHSLALSRDGDIYAWGDNFFAAVGDGTRKDVPKATKIDGGAAAGVKFAAIAAGSGYSLALDTKGKMYGWGYNDSGTLATGENRPHELPVPAEMPAGVTFKTIAAGAYHALALTSDGRLYSWGLNDRMQRGGDFAGQRPPLTATPVLPGKKFTQIAAGERFSVALGADGKAYVWGGYEPLSYDGYTMKPYAKPKAVTPKGKNKKVRFVDIAAGTDHVVALGDNGRIFAWGLNRHGQLGNGKTKTSVKPVLVKKGAIPKAAGKAGK